MLRIITTSATRQLCQRPSLPAQYRQLSSAAPSKIGILPFAEQSKEALRLLGARIYAENTKETASSFGQIFRSTESQSTQIQEETKVNSVECVYLPYWTMDAKVVIGVNTPSGSAKLHTYFDSFPIPAHSDPGLQLLSVSPPAPNTTRYQPLDPPFHLAGVDGQVPRVLPFLFTPTTLARAAAEIQVSNVFQGIPLMGLSKIAVVDPADRDKTIRSIEKGEKRAQSKDVLQFDNSHFSIEYFSCSPLLLPLRMVHFTNSCPSIDQDRRQLTLAVPAWETPEASNAKINYHYDSPKLSDSVGARQAWTRKHIQERTDDTLKLFCHPRLPVASVFESVTKKFGRVPSHDKSAALSSQIRQTMEAQVKGSWKRLLFSVMLSIHTKFRESHLGSADVLVEEEMNRDAVELANIQHVMRYRLQEHINKALSLDLGDLQAQTGAGRLSTGVQMGEKEIRFGHHIDWDDPLITAASGREGKSSLHDHRAFFEQDLEVQQAEIDHFRKHRAGKDASKAAAIVAKERAKRDKLAPPEVKTWLRSLPSEIHKATTT